MSVSCISRKRFSLLKILWMRNKPPKGNWCKKNATL